MPHTMTRFIAETEQRADRHHAAVTRLERFGCCGVPNQRRVVEVVDTDGYGNVLRRWAVVKCGVLTRQCPAADIASIYKLWSLVNQTRKGSANVDN